MKKKRILFISQMFAPEFGAGAARSGDLSREWCQSGHAVTILTGFPNYPSGRRFSGFDYGNRVFKRELKDGIEIVRTFNWFSKPGSFADRMLNSFSSLVSNSLWGLFAKRRFDLVIASSPQPFILIQGWMIARLHRIPFVAEIRDPWPEVVSIRGFFSKRLPCQALRKYITRMYHACDMLVGVADNYRDLFSEKYDVPESKIAVIRNGCNSHLFQPGLKENEFREKHGLTGKFVCSFVGNVGNFLRCETLVRAAHSLRSDPDIVFIFVGSGAGLKKVGQVKEELGADNVRLLGSVPREKVPQVYHASDVSIAHAMNHPYYSTCIGAKIWEIMGSGVPILVGFRGETQQIIEEAQAGYSFEPENAEELAFFIKKIKNDPDLAQQLGRNGRQFIESGCTRRQLAEKYLQEIDRILGDSS